MRKFNALVTVLLVLLAAPAAPLAGSAGIPAAPVEDPPPTSNVRKTADYEGANNRRVAVGSRRSYVADYESVRLHDVSKASSPREADVVVADTGIGIEAIDAAGAKVAMLVQARGYFSTLYIHDTSYWTFQEVCHLNFSWSPHSWAESVRLSADLRYAYAGFGEGLVTVDIAHPVSGECQQTGYYHNSDTRSVGDVFQKGATLYFASYGVTPSDEAVYYVTELSLADPAHPTYMIKHQMDAAVLSIAVTDNGAIFAGLYPHGLQILYEGADRTYLPDREVYVATDDAAVYVGTDLDLEVLNPKKLGPPLRTARPMIGRYSDPSQDFYHDLAPRVPPLQPPQVHTRMASLNSGSSQFCERLARA
jgi:hypothetical protein